MKGYFLLMSILIAFNRTTVIADDSANKAGADPTTNPSNIVSPKNNPESTELKNLNFSITGVNEKDELSILEENKALSIVINDGSKEALNLNIVTDHSILDGDEEQIVLKKTRRLQILVHYINLGLKNKKIEKEQLMTDQRGVFNIGWQEVTKYEMASGAEKETLYKGFFAKFSKTVNLMPEEIKPETLIKTNEMSLSPTQKTYITFSPQEKKAMINGLSNKSDNKIYDFTLYFPEGKNPSFSLVEKK